MPRDFVPRKDGDFAVWAAAMVAIIAADPELYLQTPASAAALVAEEAVFAAAYRTAAPVGTRSRADVAARNAARKTLEGMLRSAAQLAKASLTLSVAQKIELGLGAPGYCSRPSAAPKDPPSIAILKTVGNRVTVRLSDPAVPSRVARLKGVRHAMFFWAVGERAPALDGPGWYFKLTSKTTAEIVFPVGLPPGMKVWISASWGGYNHKDGPRAAAVSTYLSPAGGTLAPVTMLRHAA